ncbi:MAG TPA: 50S ribosomal protein L5 [Myxococcota bacterium]|nr:50S ribosomal protein L5 [Myxococcota bacterium]HQK49974.1 50S ribosomal protein L5 [Myxococcota bacterium]
MTRLQKKYEEEVVPALMNQFAYRNRFQVPRLVKVTLNMGLGEATQNPKIIENSVEELGRITGQRPVVTRCRKSIAAFKVRKGNTVGVSVTLRGDRMWEFLDRLLNVALPRVRDFRGVSTKAFDGHGDYTLGLREQIIFPEVDYDKVEKLKGMNITVGTSARNDEEALALLKGLGMPFRK